MKTHPKLSSTTHNYLTNTSNPLEIHKCETCQLEFQSPAELHNHKRKFCTDSGFDTLAGLNVRLKNPNFGMGKKKLSKRKIDDSLTYALEEIGVNKAFIPGDKELRNDLLTYQRHEEEIKYLRPYAHVLSKNSISTSEARRSRSLYMNATNFIEEKTNYGQKTTHPHQELSSGSNAYSFTESYIQKLKSSNSYISPPSIPQTIQPAKKFSLLERSDMSIKRMSEEEKREYVVRKLLELEQIEEGYKKNGGKNDEFIEGTKKMKLFYERLLQDVNTNGERGRMFGGESRESECERTRVSTPMSKLDELNASRGMAESLMRREDGKGSVIKSKISEIHQKSMAKRQEQVRKRFKTDINEAILEKNNQNYDILDEEMFKKLSLPEHNKNQIIVIPIQQPSQLSPYNPSHQEQNNQIALKYIESLSALKDEQSKTFLSLMEKQSIEMKKMYEQELKSKDKMVKQNSEHMKILEKKYEKLVNKVERQQENVRRENNIVTNSDEKQNNFRIYKNKNQRARTEYSLSLQNEEDKEYREHHSDLENIRTLNLESSGYHTLQNDQLTQEEKILMQMQHEERDELQLFAHLPYEIQQIKLQSLKELGEKRFEMEKEVIKQKMEKLHLSEEMKHFELERVLFSEELENEKKKIAIHKLMKKKIKGMVKEEFEQREEEKFNYLDDHWQGNETMHEENARLLTERDSQNATPISNI